MTFLRTDAFALGGPAVIAKTFGDETVVANLDTGFFYSVGASGVDIWSAIERGQTLEQICAMFAATARAAGEIDQSIEAFIARLIEEQLIVAAGPPAGTDAAAGQNLAYCEPTIEKFDDLQGLLLVDPIHDVSEQGWPLMPEDGRAQ